MGRGERPAPTGFDRALLDRRLTELGRRSIDAVARGLHWGYVTSVRNGTLGHPGAKMLPALAAFAEMEPRELFTVTDAELTVCHLRHFRGLSMQETAAAREWSYVAYKAFELGEPLPKRMSTSAAWSRTAKVFEVPEQRMRQAWEASHRAAAGAGVGVAG
ncbi:hypothetical protein AB0O47_40045 [Streptomyces noursei]|uniref:hypothetical protein n=1 Tax=Streptomyces noursei TaxID=1971 RepID=UPI00344BE195